MALKIMTQLPRAMLIDMDDTILSAYGRPEIAWNNVAKEFADEFGPVSSQQVAAEIVESGRRFWATAEAAWRLKLEEARHVVVQGGFDALAANGHAPLQVTFMDTSTGWITNRFWDFGDGSTSTSQNPQHTYTVPGKYVATLTVTDNLGEVTSDTVAIDAMAPNLIPVAKFIVTPPGGQAPLSVVLTSDESYDPDGAIGNRQWDFSDDGSTYFGETAYHTFSRPGTWTVKLTVFDNDGAKGISTQTVVVTR